MRSPLWILTSSFVCIFVLVLLFIILSQQSVPVRKSLKPHATIIAPIKDVSKINVALIYENDLFNTYMRPEPAKPETPQLSEVPKPPMPQPMPQLPVIKPEFFAPLDITLKGVIYAHNDKDNRVIIADNKSKNETLYKIGDHVEDADIIHISKNKVVFLRSNGQQETVFITPAAAQKDPMFVQDTAWSQIVKSTGNKQFIIDPHNFITRIASPAQLLDMLDLTTAFEKGKSLGLRVGKMDQRSVGHVLGLQYGDIITSIQDIPTISTKYRVEIFQSIMKTQLGSTISLKIIRNGEEQEMYYLLQRLVSENEEPAPEYGAFVPAPASTISANARSLPDKQMKLARKDDKTAMIQHGGKNALLQRLPK